MTYCYGSLVLGCSQYIIKFPCKFGEWFQSDTGWVRLIRSHSSARFCFELSGNLNYKIICNSNLAKNFGLEISLN